MPADSTNPTNTSRDTSLPAIPQSRFRKSVLGSRLFFIFYLIVTSLLCTEGALRVVGWVQGKALRGRSQGWESIWAFSPELHHRLAANGMIRHRGYEYDYIWTNNSLGMRDRERTLVKDSNTFRALFLGDSMVQGQGVPLDDTIAATLESRLNRQKREKRIEVWNCGVFGYGPMLEDFYLHKLIDSASPDIVLVAFTLENDVGDDYFYTHAAHYGPSGEFSYFDDHTWPWTKINEALDSQAQTDTILKPTEIGGLSHAHLAWDSLKRNVLSHSRIFQTLRDWKAHSEYDRNYRTRREREFALVRERQADIEYDSGLVNYPVLTLEQRLEYWKTSVKYLRDMAALSRSHGIPFVLVVIPPYQRLSGETIFDEPYQVLDEFGSQAGISVIQLLPDFLKVRLNELYFRYDRHWTRGGNRLAATVVDRELRRLNCLPKETSAATTNGSPAPERKRVARSKNTKPTVTG
jgi:hypothetical protein